MKLIDLETTPLECDRRTWVYSNGNSITFAEIEADINKKIKNMKVRLYGEYDPTNLSIIKPYVIARFETKDGYIRQVILEKQEFKESNDIYCDYLIKQAIYAISNAMFIKDESEVD